MSASGGGGSHTTVVSLDQAVNNLRERDAWGLSVVAGRFALQDVAPDFCLLLVFSGLGLGLSTRVLQNSEGHPSELQAR